jgi:glycosyl transferase family 25
MAPVYPQLPCFIINLTTAHERRVAMSRRLAEQRIDATWIDAVDGQGAQAQALLARADMHRATCHHGSLKPAEIACVLSHLQVYRRMAAERLPMVVVLEDDVILANDAPTLLATRGAGAIATGLRAGEAAVVLLTHVKRGWRARARPVGDRMLVPIAGPAWLASGYVLTLAAAERLCTLHSSVWMAADNWSLIRRVTGIHLLAVSPPGAWEAPQAQVSSIGAGARRQIPARTLWQRLAASWHRNVIRPLFTRRLPDKQ